MRKHLHGADQPPKRQQVADPSLHRHGIIDFEGSRKLLPQGETKVKANPAHRECYTATAYISDQLFDVELKDTTREAQFSFEVLGEQADNKNLLTLSIEVKAVLNAFRSESFSSNSVERVSSAAPESEEDAYPPRHLVSFPVYLALSRG